MKLRHKLHGLKLAVENRAVKRVQRWTRILQGEEVYFPRQVSCATKRLGSEYGGWIVCPELFVPQSVVYSVGIGKDISFDLALIKRYGMNVFGFDPTPSSIEWLKIQNLPSQFHHFPYAIGAADEEVAFYPPVRQGNNSHSFLNMKEFDTEPIYVTSRRITTIMQELQHTHIDLLKIDIEGAEYQVIDDLLRSQIPIKQLLVEFHHRQPEIGFAATRNAVNSLMQRGFRLFAVSASGEEYSFLS